MESWRAVGGGARQASKRPGSSRIPCRNFARGTCRWGQNCRFSHDRKSTQICRYFQNGFCGYGDCCSYQHISEAPAFSRCGTESAYHGLEGTGLSGNRRGSEPAILPEASVRSRGRSRRESEPAVLGTGQLQRNFESMSMSFDEEDEDKEKTFIPKRPSNWALSKEFVPRETNAVSSSQELKIGTTSLKSESESTKETASASLPSAESKAAGSSAAAIEAAVERSKDVVCGICMDKISQKILPEERLFGILPNCTHAYCVSCIRKWRKSRDFHSTVIKGCPECRVTSTYFIPNKYWVSDAEEKEKLIEKFKARTSKIRCKFFVRSNGHCPFKSECIYLHELPSGQLPAARLRQRPHRRNRSPFAYNPSPSDSSEEEDEDVDVCLIQWALTFALLHKDTNFDFSDFLWDSSDSSD
ncbi:probable E3 ubiquitin-protein ligase makorin-2 [Protobothrops mucrosquamatus]|uniref:probable E3 ubiquitin-protein ligase makorin-2 n=1 Tax=Protobothrops mucrosquamatus TaxID=103944 RepID=UPI000775A78F|nr:probable E3 ubiquitin-protein ligase makorin-2 [Protobothrops mucrosquamatus]